MEKLISQFNVQKVFLNDIRYPGLLGEIPNPPDPLYFLGNLRSEVFDNTLAVVGSRAITSYGEWVVNNLVREIARQKITIVSGFMYGVDALAHKVCLEVGGFTIAVMAGGIRFVVPSYQKDLFLEIVRLGLAVSEFDDKKVSGRWMFARRNRIVAGLSKAVLVVEAGEKSGSLITASFAKKYKRHIFVVPSNLNSPNFLGIAKLIKNGATIVTEPWDILKVFFNEKHKISFAGNKRLITEKFVKAKMDFSGNDICVLNKVYKALTLEPLNLDLLVKKTKLEVSQILQSVTSLLLCGLVVEKGGKYYVN